MFTSTDKYSDEIAQTMPVSCFLVRSSRWQPLDLARIVREENVDRAEKKRKTETEDAIVIE